ncbi:delta(14)-sterol reductase TM7SF2 [Astyanax mexicanus]|uniref:Delta(14)-sterol reductase TM7SF2 n=1 Tax=Astyanax mexicanus TaxID=7994 RepID=W5JZT4_ASTMX|nr:delta(14)-sterol reductase TM7SF2 [Astyanax mexicanus]
MDQQNRSDQMKNSVGTRGQGEEPAAKPDHSEWNQVYLAVVSVLLGPVLLVLLDGCSAVEPGRLWAESDGVGVALWDWTAFTIVVIFTVLQGALYYLPVGQVVEGKMGNQEKRLKYSLNGLHAFGVCVVLLVGAWQGGWLVAGSVTGRVLPLVSAGCAVALLISVCLYLRPDSAHSHENTTGGFLQDFLLGREADPRLGKIDVKQFAMVRIGFIGWGLMDVCYVLRGVESDSVSSALLLTTTFQLVYILDFLIDEDTVLDTKEFMEDSIGFLMVLGEYIWIPFFSSLPVYFLLQRPNHIHFLSAVPVILLFGFGFLVYYLSNEQKSGFRRNPHNPAYSRLETIRSPSGRNLLVSGWFGWVRHPNYLGDVVMMLAWCLPCGFCSVLPYLPALQCFNLLRKRSTEVEESCREKHGSAWAEYCRRVPYKLIPYIY